LRYKNKPLPLNIGYYYCEFSCAHSGTYKSKSKGIRPNQKSQKMNNFFQHICACSGTEHVGKAATNVLEKVVRFPNMQQMCWKKLFGSRTCNKCVGKSCSGTEQVTHLVRKYV